MKSWLLLATSITEPTTVSASYDVRGGSKLFAISVANAPLPNQWEGGPQAIVLKGAAV